MSDFVVIGFLYHLAQSLKGLTKPWRLKETLVHLKVAGFDSAPVIIFCLSFAAAVTVFEYAYHMNLVVHNVTLVPGLAALLILREMGAVLAALLLTSRIGAGIAAELGSMKITEQLEALELLNVDRYQYLVIPRLVACILASAMLTVFADTACLLASVGVSHFYIGTSVGQFVSAMNHFASFGDFSVSILKGAVFGAVIPLISCFYGFRCQAGAEGVGKATTQAVVANAVSIIILDFVITFLFTSS